VSSSLGRALSNSKGRVMYLFSKDTHNKSHCHGACAQAWPRVTSSVKPRAGSKLHASHLARTSTHQVTYYGHPLYYFVGDPGKGHTGEGAEGFYLVSISGKAIHKKKPAGGGGTPKPYVPPAATTAAEVSTGTAGSDGTVITDGVTGRTLYELSSDSDTSSTFSCTGTCQQTWIPLLTDGTPTVAGSADQTKLGTVTRADDNGEVQVTYNHHPVYLYTGDTAAGTDNGNLIYDPPGYWYALTAAGAIVT
jgi:predicted lipoprotein with Yx(FWY)xxD motif